MYVALEGIDTCGKSTQITLLKSHYPDAIFTKEPGGSVLGEAIRELVLFTPQKAGFALDKYAEAFLFLADRAQHYTQVLSPNMDKLIITDRSVISGIAYAKDIDIEQSIELNRYALRGCFPDLVVILELDRVQLQERLAQKAHDSIESRGIEYMLEIQNRLVCVVKQMGLEHIVINANKPREEICTEIKTYIDRIFMDSQK